MNDWLLDSAWKEAVSAARHGLGASPAERAMRLINARAGKSLVAHFAPGELARLVGIPESDVHAAVEALINAHQLGAEHTPTARSSWPTCPPT